MLVCNLFYVSLQLGEERIMAAHLVENADDSDVLVSTLMNHVQLQGVPAAIDGVLGGRVPVQLLQSVLGSVDPYDSCFILPFEHDVVTAVLDDGHGRAIGAAEMTQVRENPHSFVREIDGGLHVAIAAGNPVLVDLSPVFRSQLAPGHVAELLLILDFLGGCQGGLQEEEGNKAGDDDKLVLLHGVREMKEIRNGGVEVGGEV